MARKVQQQPLSVRLPHRQVVVLSVLVECSASTKEALEAMVQTMDYRCPDLKETMVTESGIAEARTLGRAPR